MSNTDLSGQRILVVEDEYFLADDTARALRDAGAEVVGPFPSEDKVVLALQQSSPTAAVVDINLGAGPSFDVARVLRENAVPFVFITGYDDEVIPPEFDDIARLQKPVEFEQIINLVATAINGSSAS